MYTYTYLEQRERIVWRVGGVVDIRRRRGLHDDDGVSGDRSIEAKLCCTVVGPDLDCTGVGVYRLGG